MPGFRALLILAATAATALAVPNAAASTPQALTVAAQGTFEIPLVLTRSTVLDQARMTVSGSGRVLGFAILDRTGKFVGAEARVAGWTDPTAKDAPLRVWTSPESLKLPAGRYRLVVLADAPVRISVPMRTGSGQSLRATRPTSARAKLTNLASLPVVAGSVRDTLRYPGGFLLSQTYQRTRAHQASAVRHCFAPASERAAVCGDRQGFQAVILSPGSVGAGYTSVMAGAYGSDMPPGKQIDVLLEAVAADLPSTAEWLTLSA